MSLKDTQDGGVFVHILIALYLFAALAIVCDDYFVPSLERICEGDCEIGEEGILVEFLYNHEHTYKRDTGPAKDIYTYKHTFI